MKRHSALLQLSREHHPALVLSKRAQRIVGETPAEIQRCMAQICAVFKNELDPHFLIEEEWLLPPLTRAGQSALVERTLSDHVELRALVKQLDVGEEASLQRFGELLGEHVRFEERELFPAVELTLTPQELRTVEQKSERAASCLRSFS